MKKILHLVLMLTIMASFASCSDDGKDDDGNKIVPSEGQSQTETVDAIGQDMQLWFYATDSWTAHVEYTRASTTREDSDWITLHQTSGMAGECSISYTVADNATGSRRQADIVILCSDVSYAFTIIQEADEIPSTEEEMTVKVKVKSYLNYGDRREFDGETEYRFYFNSDGQPTGFMCKSRDEIVFVPDAPSESKRKVSTRDDIGNQDHELYVDNVTEGKIRYNGNEVSCTEVLTMTYYNGNVETEKNEHHAVMRDGRIVSGWYQYDNEDKVSYELTYNALGQMIRSTQKDNRETNVHDVDWNGDNMQVITWDSRGLASFSAGTEKNLHSVFDVNMFWIQESEMLDFAFGDCSRIWSLFGMTGKTSANIFKHVDETVFGDPTKYTIDILKNTMLQTKAIVTLIGNSGIQYEHEYEITYPSSLK